MAKTTKTSTVSTVKTPVVSSEHVKTDVRDEEIEQLKKSNAELNEKLNQLMQMLSAQTAPVSGTPTNENNTDVMNALSTTYNPSYTADEISPNKQVMVMSLCYGILNLGNGGNNAVIKFSKYGETRPVLYSTLMNLVNYNLSFAQTGKFYIMDKDAVYNLGLSSFYENIIPSDVINNITDYSEKVIESIVKSINDDQKDLLVKLLSDRIYKGEHLDANKINLISKLSRKDIMKCVEEMRTYAK